MLADDPVLPAATALTGGGAAEVLAPVIGAAGGRLVSCTTTQVQYRPQSDLVVRYRCEIRSAEGVRTDTVLAATTAAGPPPGTVPVEAIAPDGTRLEAGVWRWPFDPHLTDLAEMVTPRSAAHHLADLVDGTPALEVVAYRPTERAVIRARGGDRTVYVKVVAPSAVPGLIERHDALTRAGLPTPRVLAHGSGWIAMEALEGTTLRDRLKTGSPRLPAPDRFRELLDALAGVHLPGAPPARSRLADAPHHARMVATVLSGERSRLDELVERLDPERPATTVATVHGDFHEAQLVVDDARVTGLLDIDDAGPGHPLDDVGALSAHLRFRAMAAEVAGDDRAGCAADYADDVDRTMRAGHDAAEVGRHVAAVLIGLATGPFRIQHPDWEQLTRRTIELAERRLAV